MGIYTARLEASVDPGAAVQTPEDIGVDLDQVEKSIVGDDGNEANREEIDAAVEGIVGEPIEEAYEAMFEAQYNYNQLMRVVGLNEVYAASTGREVVMEAVDFKGFFKRVKQIIVNLFEAITKAFKKFTAYLVQVAMADKKYVEKYKAKIVEGGSKNWSAKGFVYKKADFSTIPNGDTISNKAMDELVNDGIPAAKADIHKYVLEEIADGAADIQEFRKAYERKLRGGEDDPIELEGKITPQQVIDILKSENDVKDMKTAYDKIKDGYKKALEKITGWEKNVSADSNEYMAERFAKIQVGTETITFAQSVLNTLYACSTAAVKANRAQARKLARQFVVLAGGNKDEGSTKHESTSLFSGIDLF